MAKSRLPAHAKKGSDPMHQKQMSDHCTIALDVMSSACGYEPVFRAANNFVKRHPDVKFLLCGNERVISTHLQNFFSLTDACSIAHASEVIEQEDKPSVVLRNKRDSSMHIAIRELAAKNVDAVVSPGNTGALVGIAKILLKTLPNIGKPVMCVSLPSQIILLDCGANLEASAGELAQFAVIGSVFVEASLKVDNPKVALLNIGAEKIKGKEELKNAYEILDKNPLCNFVGYIEPHELFFSDVKVVITDGFSGNLVIKTMEGTIKFVTQSYHQSFRGSFFCKALGRLVKSITYAQEQKHDPDRHNGGVLLGLNGIVVKSHSDFSAQTFETSIAIAYDAIINKINEGMSCSIQKLQMCLA